MFLKFIRYGVTTIRFDYEYKKDQFHGYVNGKPYDVLRRAKVIQIITRNVPIRRYILDYKSHDTQGRIPSRLHSITECAGNGTSGECLNPLVLDMGGEENSYQDLAGGRTLSEIMSAYANSPEILNDLWLGVETPKKMNGAFQLTEKVVNFNVIRDEEHFVDMNDDALPDLVAFKHDGVHIAYNNGDGTFSYSTHIKQFGTNEDTGDWELIPDESAGDWDPEKELRTVSDINADGRPDLVGFRRDGKLMVAYQTAQGVFDTAVEVAMYYDAKECKTDIPLMCFKSSTLCLNNLCQNKQAISCNDDQNSLGDACLAGEARVLEGQMSGLINWVDGWRYENYLRMLSDMNGDTYPDIVTFVEKGVEVRINNQDGSFRAPVSFSADFGYADNWYVRDHPRVLTDMDGDGLPDIVGFADDGVHIAYNKGDGTSFDYDSAPVEADVFGKNGGWETSKHPRMIVDVNGDGYNDIIGFDEDGVYVAFNKGDRSFKPAFRAVKGFGFEKGEGYLVGVNPRTLADIDGNGLADIIGFGDHGVNVAYNLGKTTSDQVFSEPQILINDFYSGNSDDQRVMDINGDGRADLVAFKDGELYSALQPERKSRIVGVADSFGNRTEIAYKSLTDKSVYTKESIAKLPMRDIPGSSLVVSRISAKAPDGSIATIDYNYYGMRMHALYGFVGFGRIDTINMTGDTTTRTRAFYRQDYPFVGTTKRVDTLVNNELVSQTFNYWTKKTLDNDRLYPFMWKQVRTDYDMSVPIKEIVTFNRKVDKYGNFGEIVSIITDKTTGESFQTTTKNTYENHEDEWILARLVRAEVTKQSQTNTEPFQSVETRVSEFAYDENTGILTDEWIEPGHDKAVHKSYIYDTRGVKIEETLEAAGVSARTTTTRYDTFGRFEHNVSNALGHVLLREYNADGQVTESIAPNGLKTSISYDAFGKKVEENLSDGTVNTYDYAFDSSVPGSLYKITASGTGKPPVTTWYSSSGHPLKVQKVGFDGRAIVETIIYDAQGNVIGRTSPHFEGAEAPYETMEYDEYNRLLFATSPSPNGSGRVQTAYTYEGFEVIRTDAKGHSERTLKNALGKVVRVEDALGGTMTYGYDAMGNLVSTIDPDGNEIRIGYDVFGNKTSQNDPDMGYWTYKYNAFGELIEQVDAKGNSTTYQYDLLGRKTLEKSGATENRWWYDTMGSYCKNTGALCLEETRVNNQTTLKRNYRYDNNQRLLLTGTHVDGLHQYRILHYDASGRIKNQTLPNSFQLLYDYNQYGYLSSVKTYKSKLKDFDPENLLNRIEEMLQKAAYYNSLYLQYKGQAYALQGQVDYYRSHAYYDLDRREYLLETAEKLETMIKQYEYYAEWYGNQSKYLVDKANEYTKKAWDLTGAQGDTEQIAYYQRLAEIYSTYASTAATQAENYITQIEQMSATVENYTNEAQWNYGIVANLLNDMEKAQEQAAAFEARSVLLSQQSDALQVIANDSNYAYFYKVLDQDALGRTTAYVNGNGLVTRTKFSDAGTMLENETGFGFDDGTVRHLEYQYDALANVVQRTDSRLDTVQTYAYDTLDRLVGATTQTQMASVDFDMAYSYDAIGNLMNKSDIGNYTYHSFKPHQVVSAGSRSLTYDANGNVVQNGDTRLTYTPFNKTASITTPTDQITFDYDPGHQRFKKTSNAGTTYYMGKDYEYEVKSDETKVHRYFVYAGGKVQAVYESSSDGSAETSYLHYDSLGSVDTVTGTTGEVKARFAYKPFGEKLKLDKNGLLTQAPAKTNRGYTGHETIESTGYINMNARLYDPTIGRFLSADTIIPAVYDTQAYNRYGYARNNPMKYTDPSGHSWLSSALGSVGDFFKKYWRTIVTIAVVAAVTLATGGLAAGLAGAIIQGAIAGFTGGFVGTLLYGGDFNAAISNGLRGALVGGISGGVAHGVVGLTAATTGASATAAESASFFESFSSGSGWGVATFKALAHGISRAAIAQAQGQNATSGFWSGFVASGFSVGNEGYGGFVPRTMMMAVAGGRSVK